MDPYRGDAEHATADLFSRRSTTPPRKQAGMPLVDSAEFPSLFSHAKRTNWGVGVVTEERDGKRTYLFEDGEERTLGAAGIELMRKIEQPDREQQATCTHLLSM